jgi:hypothetical protein
MSVWTFIKGVQNKKNRDTSWNCEHILEALFECIQAGLLRATTVCQVQAVEDIEVRLRLIGQLMEEGGEYSSGILFSGIPEVKEKIGHVC